MTLSLTASRTLDYHPCRYGSSKIVFRGPARKINGDYVSFVGGTETFGLYVKSPFPALLERSIGYKCLNLGCQSAGVDAFLHSPGILNICSMARVTVIQIMGAANMSNRLFTVDKRHNGLFIRASRRLKEIFPEPDYASFGTIAEVLAALAKIDGERLHQVRHEMQCAWVARMRSLLDAISGPKILLWVADHPPYSQAAGGTICRDPLFVDRAMLNAICASADALIEVVATKVEVDCGRQQLVFEPHEAAAAAEILGPYVHDRVAEMLEPELARFIRPDTRHVSPRKIAFEMT